MNKIAVLIPCYNEEKTVRKVVEDYRRELPEALIYVYNNNSSDKTYEIASEMAQTDNHIIVVNEYRQGKGNVIRSMFKDIEADCYLMIDGDDTYPPEFAGEMVRYVLDGQADMVIGDRLSSTYFTENKRPFHNFGNVLVRKLINKFFKSNIKDIMTGYRAFSKSFVKGFPVLSHGFEIETEMSIFAIDKNYLLKEIPVTYRDRPQGSESKLNTYSDGFKVIKTIFRLFKNYKPFAFFSLVALIFLILSLILVIPVLISYFETGLVARFPSLIVGGVFGLAALFSLFVGIILDVELLKHKQNYELMMNIYNSIEKKTNR
ncbi:MAG: glycosyltransferase family 2 protein [Fusobacteria bacterium]|nr:glycosyltransferase family 2 protein [Fusobacteriota bacterium]